MTLWGQERKQGWAGRRGEQGLAPWERHRSGQRASRLISADQGLPLKPPARSSSPRAIRDPLVHWVPPGQLYPPSVGHVGQQELGEVAVCALVPVHSVRLQVLPCVAAEVEVQVQHIEAVLLGLGRAVEIGFDHTDFHGGGGKLDLGRDEAAGDFVAHGHGRVPHQEARLGQHLAEAPKQSLQVPPVTRPEVLPVPGDVPEARVHDDQVRVVLTGLQLLQDVLQVVGVHARQEVEAHQVLAGAELAHLAVVRAVVHVALLAPMHELILLESVLPLGLELAECEQAVLLQQEHQILVHSPLDRVPQDNHELVVEQLPHFGGQ